MTDGDRMASSEELVPRDSTRTVPLADRLGVIGGGGLVVWCRGTTVDDLGVERGGDTGACRL